MIARLGNVLYWTGLIVAIPAALWALFNLWFGTYGGSSMPGENGRQFLIGGGVAIFAFLLGRACQYVLAGR